MLKLGSKNITDKKNAAAIAIQEELDEQQAVSIGALFEKTEKNKTDLAALGDTVATNKTIAAADSKSALDHSKDVLAKLGDITKLSTTIKTSVVNALNEVFGMAVYKPYKQSSANITINVNIDDLATDGLLALHVDKQITDLTMAHSNKTAGVYSILINVNPGTKAYAGNLSIDGIKVPNAYLTIKLMQGLEIPGNVYMRYCEGYSVALQVAANIGGNIYQQHCFAGLDVSVDILAGSDIGTINEDTDVLSNGGVNQNSCVAGRNIAMVIRQGTLSSGTITTPAAIIHGGITQTYNTAGQNLTQTVEGGINGANAPQVGHILQNNNAANANIEQLIANNVQSFVGYFTVSMAERTNATSSNTVTLTAAVPAAWRSVLPNNYCLQSTNAATGSSANNHVNIIKITTVSSDGLTLTLASALAKTWPAHTAYVYTCNGATQIYYGTDANVQYSLNKLKNDNKVAIRGTGCTNTNTKITAIDTTNKLITISPALNANNAYNGSFTVCNTQPPLLNAAVGVRLSTQAANKGRTVDDLRLYGPIVTVNAVGCNIDGVPLPAGAEVTAVTEIAPTDQNLDFTISKNGFVTGTISGNFTIRRMDGGAYIQQYYNSAGQEVHQYIGNYGMNGKLETLYTSQNGCRAGLHCYAYAYNYEGSASNCNVTIGYRSQYYCTAAVNVYLDAYGESTHFKVTGYQSQSRCIGTIVRNYVSAITVCRYLEQTGNIGYQVSAFGTSTGQATTAQILGYTSQVNNIATLMYAYRLNMPETLTYGKPVNAKGVFICENNSASRISQFEAFWCNSTAAMAATYSFNRTIHFHNANNNVVFNGATLGINVANCEIIFGHTAVAAPVAATWTGKKILKAIDSQINFGLNTDIQLYKFDSTAGRDPSVTAIRQNAFIA